MTLRALDTEGIAPHTFNLREPSLDDVFLSLTGHRTEEEEKEAEDRSDPKQKRRKKRMSDLEHALPVATGEFS